MTPETYQKAQALMTERQRIERSLELIERVDDVRLLRANTADRVSVELTDHPAAEEPFQAFRRALLNVLRLRLAEIQSEFNAL